MSDLDVLSMAKLQEREELCNMILDNSQDVIFFKTPDGICHYVSPAITTVLGYEVDEVLGTVTYRYYHPEDVARVYESQQQDHGRFTVRVRHKQGHYVWMETTVKRSLTRAGMEIFVAISRDVTERKMVEEKLRKIENDFEHVERIAHLGSWEWDVVNNELSCTEELCRIYGIDPANWRSGHAYQEYMQFIHDDDRDEVVAAIEASLTGKNIDIEYRLVHGDGSIHYAYAQGAAMFDETGRPLRVIGTLLEIDEHKKMEEALRSAQYDLKEVIRHQEVMICKLVKTDGEFIFTMCEGALMYELGLTSEEIVGHGLSRLWPEGKVPKILKLLEQAWQGRQVESEYDSHHQEGRIYHALLRPMKKNGVVTEVVAYFSDITERKKTEEVLLQSEKLSIAGQLAAGVAHEIRNPLTALKGFVQLLQRENMSHRYLEIMSSELDRIEQIISELLVLAKPQAITYKQKDVHSIIHDVVTLIDTQAILSNVNVVTEIESGLPELLCDENQLKQVFINFLKNAIEAMPTGGTIRIEVQRKGGRMICIRFVDEGCGISEERLSRLGEPFYSTKEKGTGLGLMVSKKIINAHHGKMSIASQVDVGTTVEVLLPSISRSS